MPSSTASFRSHPRRRAWAKKRSTANSSRSSNNRDGQQSVSAQSSTSRPAGSRSSVPRSVSAPRRRAAPPRIGSFRYRSVPTSEHTSTSLHEQHVDEEQADEDADALGEVVMAVEMNKRGTLGCAYYVTQDEKLYFMEDMQLSNVEMIDMLKLFVSPTVVLLSSSADDAVLNVLDPNAEARSQTGSDPWDLPYNLQLRPKSEFGSDAAKTKLSSLRIGEQGGAQVSFVIPGDVHAYDDFEDYGDDMTSGRQAQLLKFASSVSMDSYLTVGCAGAILCYLQKRRASRFLPGDPAAQSYFRVSVIEMFTMRGTMFVNADTLLSLQIIQSENHPNSHNQGPTKANSGAKEGLSLYGLFHGLAATTQGRLMLRQYFLRPSTDITVIKERLDAVTIFTRPDNEVGLTSICKHLKGVKNIRGLTAKLRKGAAGGTSKGGGIARSIWHGLQKFTYHAINISQKLAQDLAGTDRLLIMTKVSEKFDTRHLQAVGQMIDYTIDFEQSQEQHRTIVKTGVDPQLDEKKRFYDGITDLLSTIARDLAERIPAGLPNELNVIYFPQIGYLIAMPMDPASGQSSWEGPEEDHWEKMFTSDRMVYYKNDQMTEMDNEFGDIYTEICDREIEIVHDLAQRVLEHEDMLNTVSDILGEVDCLCALAQGARKYNLCRPRLTDENVIEIEGGRHLLQELTVPSYIPNDTYMVGGKGQDQAVKEEDTASSPTARSMPPPSRNQPPRGPSTIILTGPNYSGKSVYLKQVALLTYLAHIGSYVPATSATIGLTDKILTRISTRESVSRNQSAFMIDLQQICMALNLATNRSLLIIDQFSKGTNAVDGAALACGVFEYLLNLGVNAPKTLAATHFHEIFENGFLLPRSPILEFGHMDVHLDRDLENAQEQITYLYQYKRGRSNDSFGTLCAAMNGIAPEIVNRAKELGELVVRGDDLVAACAVMPEEEAEELVMAEQVARRYLAVNIEGNMNIVLDQVLAEVEDMSVE